MSNDKFTAKQIAVFEAVTKLVNEGANLYEIKVSYIAQASGIGKGTVYEYFKSKEEIVAGTIFYNLDNILQKLKDKLKTSKTFDEKFTDLFDVIDDAIKYNAKTFHLLFSNIAHEYTINENTTFFSEINKRKKQIVSIVGEILLQAITEKVIKIHSVDKISYVVNGVIMAYVNECMIKTVKGKEITPKDTIKLRKYAKEMLINGLN